MTVDLSMIVAICAIVTTFVTAITFFNRLKWDNDKHKTEMTDVKKDVNNLGGKVNSIKDDQRAENKELLAKFEELDRTMVAVSTTMEHIEESVREIKDKLNNV